jgi:hypothetical protein
MTDPATPVNPAYPRGLRLFCPCGEVLEGADEDAMVDTARAHLAEVHPHLADAYTRDNILFMAQPA